MAFSFSDFLSLFSQAADGQRLRGPNEAARDTTAGDPSGILNYVQTTGAPQPAQAAPAPSRPRPRVQSGPIDQAMQMGPSQRPPESLDGILMGPTMGGPQGSMDGILMGPSQQTPPPLNVESTGPLDPTLGPKQGQPEIPQGLAQYEQGIMGKVGDFLGPNFLGRLGNGLMVAGSQDPAKALVMLRQQEAEEREAQAKLAAAQKPKVTHLPGTPFFSVMGPNGSFQILDSAQLKDYYAQERDNKLTDRVDGMVAQGKINSAVQQAQVDRKTAAEARPMLNETATLLGKYDQASEMINGQGTWAQIQGIPGISGIAGFFGTDDAAKNKFLQSLTVSETLLNSALSKGAISDREMSLFKSPIPALTDDREKVWKPFIEQRRAVLAKLAAFQQAEAARGERVVSPEAAVQSSPQVSAQPQATPKAPAGGLPSVSNDADYAKIPSGSRYVSPDGKIRQKP